MAQLEYKVIAAPTKGQKAAGVKSAEARFALAVESLMNDLAAEGWCYLRSDLLPSEERQGLTSSQTVYRSVLVFYRERAADAARPAPPAMTAVPPVAPPVAQPGPEPAVPPDRDSVPPAAPRAEPLRARPLPVNDVPEDPFDPR